ncbi:MAG: ArsR family transcriptional regulator [Candidatus Parabeggiatoa sp. nov. 2]|nr:MAG: ArsR family transcriptional regulator [Beggiatoa sp. 4572_84]RKZ61268.1 MAG: ArsR family transcriptional regulator [Gammaproteobacteria bacterium]
MSNTVLTEKSIELSITNGLEEDVVWRREFAKLVSELPSNAVNIWHYGFTEMLNNAIDHSGGNKVIITFKQTAISTEITLLDNGEGIFRKIQQAHHLEDERHAILELSKGKLTTDPDNHTGEGIFFASRMFDDFMILSSGVYFSHNLHTNEEWIIEDNQAENGTMVFMKLLNNTTRTDKEIFDQFASEDEDYQFTKTIVPARLARYGDEQLVSRSQAKRLMARVDRFKVVLLDFSRVETIGQAFADEVFRVFARRNTDIKLVHINANEQVMRMIKRAFPQ